MQRTFGRTLERISAALVFVFMLAFASLCFAEIPRAELTIGGISLGATNDYVRSIYGSPTRVTYPTASGITWHYNNTFAITFYDGRANTISSTGNNGLGTPSGVKVGMTADALDRYGKPYSMDREGNVEYYAYWAPGRSLLTFGVANNRICSIEAH